MDNKTQKQANNNGINSNETIYDVFISYRHSSSDSGIHSTSLARSIEQKFKSEGLKVFFDCSEKGTKSWQYIEKSKFIIILVTSEFLTTIKEHPYNSTLNNESNANRNGTGLIKELQEIEKRLDDGTINGENIILLNIDKRFTTGEIQKALSSKQYEKLASINVEVFPLLTDKTFPYLMQYLIDRIIGDEKKEISVFNNKKDKTIFTFVIIGIALLMFALGVMCYFYKTENKELKETFNERLQEKEDSIGKSYVHLIDSLNNLTDSLNTELNQYKKECLIFAGGGTVQQYLSKKYSIDVKEYPLYPSKYIHLPSKDAWSLLWDDFTEDGEKRSYWPIVLSAEKINDSIRKQKEQLHEVEVVGYEVGTVSLKVQIINHNKDNSYRKQADISLEELWKLLKNELYIVHTTTERSGTYNAYKDLLKSSGFNLDSLIQKQGRRDFTPDSYESDDKSDSEKNHIFLANSFYYYSLEKPDESVLYTKTQDSVTMPLFVYTIAMKKPGTTRECKLCSQVEEFFKLIGCNTDTTITRNPDKITMLESNSK